MITKEKNEGNTVGKVRKRTKHFPVGLDVSNLNYLQHGDVSRVAEDFGYSPDYVSKVKNGLCGNVKVLAKLLEKGGKNKLELQKAAA